MKDSDIRRVVLSEFNRAYKDDPDTLIIEELGLCQGEARVDIAVVNGSIHGFEIKSDQDTLKRLAGQIAIYSRVLDFITIIVGGEHFDAALSMIPSWWGVIIAKEKSGQVQLKYKRKGKRNPSLDPMAVVQLLWREEAYKILKDHALHKGLVNRPRAILWNKLVEHMPSDELSTLVRSIIKSRANWRSDCKQA